MINKLRFFSGELKHSLLFVIVVTLQVAISIFLLNLTLTKAFNTTVETKYYSKAVADKSYVMFNYGSYFGDSTVGELSKLTDLNDLATTFQIGNIGRQVMGNGSEQTSYVTSLGVVTPAVMKNFHTFNTNIKKGNSKGYYEAQLRNYSLEYKIGEMYDVVYQTTDKQSLKTIKIKIMDSTIETDYFYNFIRGSDSGQLVHSEIPFEIMICDDIASYDYAELSTGIFINDQQPSFYEKLGFTSKTVQKLYDDVKANNLEDAKYMSYMAMVIIMFTFVSTFCLYMIDVYKVDRKRAVNYICGVTSKSQLIIEGIKIVFIFAVAFLANLAVSVFLGAKELHQTMGGNMVTVPYAMASTAIMLGVYSLAISVGMIKYIKTKPIKIINNVH